MKTLQIEHYQQKVDEVLLKTLETLDVPADKIKKTVEYALFPGGKRLRPLLVFLSGELLAIKHEIVEPIAAAVEIIHCYSLIHDDLPSMDDDKLRRGRPTCHLAFDEATAILAGDGMQALAVELLLDQLIHYLPAGNVLNITKTLMQASGVSGMVSGQSLDLTELTKPNVNGATLRKIHSLKTGCLISACIKMVNAAQIQRHEHSHCLENFADQLGLVFQMQDDYLDYYASKSQLGKDRASDQMNQKTTFADLYSQQQLQQLIYDSYQQAQDILKPFDDRKKPLQSLLDFLKNRSQLPRDCTAVETS